MRAITAVPGQRGSVGVEEVAEPAEADGALLVRGLLMGVCGTDREIAEGAYGEPPAGESKLIIGHEGLGEVLEAPARVGLSCRGSGGRDRAPPGSGAVPGVRRRASGTCAATTGSPSAGSSGVTDTEASSGASSRTSRSRSRRRWATSACCSSRRRCWRRRGTRSTASRSARSSSGAGRWSPARARSGCWRASSGCSAAMRCTSSTWRPRVPNATSSRRSARATTPATPPTSTSTWTSSSSAPGSAPSDARPPRGWSAAGSSA